MKGQNFCIYYSFFLFYDEFWFRKVEPIDYKSYFRNQVFFTQSGKKWVWRLEPCPMQGMTVNADNTATYYTEDSMTLSIYVVKHQTFYVWIPFSI